MASSSSRAILWFDTHIGENKECNDLKNMFQSGLKPVAVDSPATEVDPINDMIFCLREYAGPVSFASNVNDALELIETHAREEKKITIIVSGTLGKELIPEILERNFTIESYYIFCGYMKAHVAWAEKYLDDGVDIQMFDFEVTLLIRLEKDLSEKLIATGTELLQSNPRSALTYFQNARSLAENAVQRNTPTDPNDRRRPSAMHRQILDGENGLIAQAQRASL